MTGQRLDDRLVGISGAIPEPEVLREQGCSALELLLAVRRLTERILGDGGKIAHLNHPTFTPIIEHCARRLPEKRSEKSVEIYLVRPFFKKETDFDRFIAQHEDYAAITSYGEIGEDPVPILRILRGLMVSRIDALICIGGKRRPSAGQKPGVVEEVEIALERFRGMSAERGRPAPIYLMASFGGATRDLYLSGVSGSHFQSAVNDQLASESDLWKAVDLVLCNLYSSNAIGS